MMSIMVHELIGCCCSRSMLPHLRLQCRQPGLIQCIGLSSNYKIRHNSSASNILLQPTLVYQDNHLLVVNKPPGWHSVPNEYRSNEKCLLNFCKRKQWGGGSHNDFLLPLHRLDQPCSGLQLYGKTSKAASRIQSRWKDVSKIYICVLDRDFANMDKLMRLSCRALTEGAGVDTPPWYKLEGYLKTSGRTVKITQSQATKDHHYAQIHWSILEAKTPSPHDYTTIAVRTQQGRRHQIRALLSQACPIAGDLRYGALQALADQSVALHAYSLQLPLKLKLGSVEPGRRFIAKPPPQWNAWFGVGKKIIDSAIWDISKKKV